MFLRPFKGHDIRSLYLLKRNILILFKIPFRSVLTVYHRSVESITSSEFSVFASPSGIAQGSGFIACNDWDFMLAILKIAERNYNGIRMLI